MISLTKQQKIDVSQNLRSVISNLTLEFENIILNDTISVNNLNKIKSQIESTLYLVGDDSA